MAKKTEKVTTNWERDFLAEAATRYKSAETEESANRGIAIDNLRFVLGGNNQWDAEAVTARKGRPMLTINKLPKFVRQVTGDQRQNRPGIQCRPVDDKSDPIIAKIIEGHIRNIQYSSFASIAYDHAFKHTVAGGHPGWWRVNTHYADDDTFDQDIAIDGIFNQFCVYPDPQTLKDVYKGGLEWCFVTDIMSQDEFKAKFGDKAATVDFEQQGRGEGFEGWFLEDKVRVAEYFYKEEVVKTLYKLEDGSVIDSIQIRAGDLQTIEGQKVLMLGDKPIKILKERTHKGKRVKWCIIGGGKILDGPKDWAGKYIPLVPVFGDTWVIEGKTHYKSLIHDSKDSQKAYNYSVSQNMEMAALQPKVPYKLTKEQIKGHEAQWNNLNNTPFPYVLYNPDPLAPGAPQRELGAQVNSSFVQLGLQASDDLKDTMGIYNAALGQASNERSGVAIYARQRESDVGMLEFIDNYGRAHIFTGMILVDLIPKIYDTERTVRTIGTDDAVGMVPINKTIINKDGSQTIINDITVGKYDIFITVGPSYTTQRMQAAESMMKLIQTAPGLMDKIGHLVVKAMDWPGADKIAEILDPANQQQGPNPALIKIQAEVDKIQAEIQSMRLTDVKTASESLLNIAKAEAAEVGNQTEQYRLEMDRLTRELDINDRLNNNSQENINNSSLITE